jgi:hypothetical protein
VTFRTKTTFNVTAETERIEMKLDESPPSRWTLDDVMISEENDPQSAFSGFAELAASVDVLIERVAFGPLWIHVECRSECSSVGILRATDETPLRRLPRRVEILFAGFEDRAKQGRTVLLPLAGTVSAGRPIGIETGGTTAILRAGQVTMLGRSVFRENIFEAGAFALAAGDQFKVEGPTLGFVVADERPALTAAYRVVSDVGTVIRPGGGEYPVSASILGRLLADDWFRALAGALGLFGGVATFVQLVLEIKNRERESAQSAGESHGHVGEADGDSPEAVGAIKSSLRTDTDALGS